MDSEKAPDKSKPAKLTLDEALVVMFGVSKAELKSQGIDTDTYAREHLDAVLDDDEVAAKIMGESAVLLRRSRKHAGRVYMFMYITVGLFFVRLFSNTESAKRYSLAEQFLHLWQQRHT